VRDFRFNKLVYTPVGISPARKRCCKAGIAVPIFAFTEKAKDHIIEKIRQSNEQMPFKTTGYRSFLDSFHN